MLIALDNSKARIKAFLTLLVKTTVQTGFPTATQVCVLSTYLNKTFDDVLI